MMRRIVWAAGLVAALCGAARAECIVKVGRIVPQTGALAAMGQMTPWVDGNKLRAIGGTLHVGAEQCRILFKIYDSQSTVTGAVAAALEALQDDQVDVLMAQGSAEMINAPSDLCESHGVACITSNTPVEAWLFGSTSKPYAPKVSFHFGVGLPDLVRNHVGMLRSLPGGFNGRIGVLFGNDPEGAAYARLFGPAFRQEGWTLVDPGPLAADGANVSVAVERFRQGGAQAVVGTLTPQALRSYLQQAALGGFVPRVSILDRATAYADAVEAIGTPATAPLSVNVWSPAFPGRSKYGGWTGQEFAAAYEAQQRPRTCTPEGAYADASYDVLFDALQRAGSVERGKLVAALATTDLETVVGHVKFDAQHASVQPLGGAQWRRDEGGHWSRESVFNGVYPEVRTTAPMRLPAAP